MDPVANLQGWLTILEVTIVLLCCYIVGREKIEARLTPPPVVVPHCPLHRVSRDKCAVQHEDDE